MPQEGRAALCRNQEQPEKLIKTFPSDYTPEDGNRFLSRPSLTRLAQEECEGWVGSSPAGQWKEAAYRSLTAQPGLQLLAPPPPSGDNCRAIFQRLRQLTGKGGGGRGEARLTTSLTAGLDKSGAHFKLLLWQKYRWLYRHLCLEFTEPKRAFIHRARSVSQGIWQGTRVPFEYHICLCHVHLNASLRERYSWELYIEFPLELFPTRTWKGNVFLLKFC